MPAPKFGTFVYAYRPRLRSRLARRGRLRRLVLAILRSSLSLIDVAMPREAPLRRDLETLPRFAANAAPAAICCFFDFAGIPVTNCPI